MKYPCNFGTQTPVKIFRVFHAAFNINYHRMKRFIKVGPAISFFILITAILPAQDVVLEKNVEDQYEEGRGPNMRHYGHGYQALGMVLPYENLKGAEAEPLRSIEYIIGYRYKIKLLSFYAVGFDISGRWINYGIRSDENLVVDEISNPLSQASTLEKLNLSLSVLGAEIYNRINIGKRGNTLGNYADIGIRGDWNYSRRIILKDKPSGTYFEMSRSVQKNLAFIEKFSTYATARIGINKYMIYANYRISEIITRAYFTPELPPLTAGFQMAF